MSRDNTKHTSLDCYVTAQQTCTQTITYPVCLVLPYFSQFSRKRNDIRKWGEGGVNIYI